MFNNLLQTIVLTLKIHATVSLGAFQLITDESKAGSCLWITNRRGLEYWPTPEEAAKYMVPSKSRRKRSPFKAYVNIQLPESFEKMWVASLLMLYDTDWVSAGMYMTGFDIDLIRYDNYPC